MTGARARSLFTQLLTFCFTLYLSALFSTASAEIQLTQAGGESLNLPEPADNIITLAPNLAELVFAAGAGKKLRAVVEYSIFPADVKKLPRVGNAFRIDLERIIEFQPDLIIAWKSGNPQTALKKLEQLGFVVWQIEITRPDEIPDTLEDISRAAGTENHGMAAAQQLREKITQLRQRNAKKTPLKYFFQIAAQPLYTINGEHLINQGLEICGGINIFSDLSALAPQVSRESVIQANPQVMIATEIDGQTPSLNVWLGWPSLQAVRNKALLYLPADEISQATPRFLDSIGLACKLLDKVRQNNQQKILING